MSKKVKEAPAFNPAFLKALNLCHTYIALRNIAGLKRVLASTGAEVTEKSFSLTAQWAPAITPEGKLVTLRVDKREWTVDVEGV